MRGGFLLAAVIGFALVAGAGCRERETPEAPRVASADAPPAVVPVGTPHRKPDGSIEYRVLVRSDTGAVYVPLEIAAAPGSSGAGTRRWVKRTNESWAYDAAADRYVLRPAARGGAPLEELFNVIFPAAPQELSVDLRYAGEAPAAESLVLRYRAVTFDVLASRAYVRPETGAGPRAPLGDGIRSVDVFRRLAAGFFLRHEGEPIELRFTVPGPGTTGGMP